MSYRIFGNSTRETPSSSTFSSSSPDKMASYSSKSTAKMPDAQAQRALIEPLLDRKFLEGDFWNSVSSDWLQQWKRHVGIGQLRKYFHNRGQPGAIETSKDAPTSATHSLENVQEDAWKLLLSWYGLADGHNTIKHVVYSYCGIPELEHNHNCFKISVRGGSEASVAETHTMRFSKMEKVGHLEWKARQLFYVPKDSETRLWGKTLESETAWQPLFAREKPAGRSLELDSDFIRSAVCLEVKGKDGEWSERPIHAPRSQETPSGNLYDQCIFDDVTSSWEMDIHDQIDDVGRKFVEHLHVNFSAFVSRAKDFVEEKDSGLREREIELGVREEKIREREKESDDRELALTLKVETHKAVMADWQRQRERETKQFEEHCDQRTSEIEAKKWELEKQTEALGKDKDEFQAELQRMSDLHEIQDSKIKLDIGGQVFTTSKLTLTKDPNSMLAAMFSGRHSLVQEADGSYFIDRDGTHFRYILNFLRDGMIEEGTLPEGDSNIMRELMTEARYYQLRELTDYLQGLLVARYKSSISSALSSTTSLTSSLTSRSHSYSRKY